MESDILTRIYERLQRNPNDRLIGLPIFHSSIVYATKLINMKFSKDYSETEVFEMMIEEGCIPEEDILRYAPIGYIREVK